jgi:hypothetical protein
MVDGEYCILRERRLREKEEEVSTGFDVGCIPSFAG